MCSFLFTNKPTSNIEYLNHFMKSRGPDHTSKSTIDDFNIIHNLLSITGVKTPQPLFDRSGELVLVFNGEVYNHAEFGNYSTDGYAIIEAYKRYGVEFTKYLDGEFSLLLYNRKLRKIYVGTDVFGTKPLYISFDNFNLGISTYKSGLTRLNFDNVWRVNNNALYIIDVDSSNFQMKSMIRKFDIKNQDKSNYIDWQKAFENSIQKRIQGQSNKVFIGLSSGYDSGAICCALLKNAIPFAAYIIEGKENRTTLNKRIDAINNGVSSAHVLSVTETKYNEAKARLNTKIEHTPYQIIRNGQLEYDEFLNDDKGAVGLSMICEKARLNGKIVYLSGQGADEVISDYGNGGIPIYKHSTIAGKFPQNLSTVFPWNNFFNSTQSSYLLKEEKVSGAFGIEGRYPFLDFNLVQEFLWLHQDLKNRHYKAPLREYLLSNNFPADLGVKIGFNCLK